MDGRWLDKICRLAIQRFGSITECFLILAGLEAWPIDYQTLDCAAFSAARHFLASGGSLDWVVCFGDGLAGGALAMREGGWLSMAYTTLRVDVSIGNLDFILGYSCEESHKTRSKRLNYD